MSKKILYIVGSVIVVAVISWLYFSGSKKPQYETAIAKRGNLTQEVSTTGRVKPSNEVDLAFEKIGRITSVNVKIGDNVFPGQILATLDDTEVQSQIFQAEAALKIQQSQLDELLKGARQEEISLYESKVGSAQSALAEAKKNAADTIQDSYTKADDAVRNKIDQFFSDPKSSSPKINFTANDTQLKIDMEWQRLSVENTLLSWKNSLENFNILSSGDDIAAQFKNTRDNLGFIKTFLEKIALAVNALQTSAGLTQTTIDGYKTAVSTGRTNINTAILNITAAEEKYNSAVASLNVSENELALKKAGATNEQIDAQRAKVEESEAGLNNYKTQLEKLSLKSPINGIVTKQDAKIGEIATAGEQTISIISQSGFKIETNVPEADIAKIKIGNRANITLDAYGDNVFFEATVTYIDPAETIIDNVPTYKTTLRFKETDEKIKSGMTANIDIITDQKENVLYVPQRAVINKNGDKIIKILVDDKNNTYTEEKITTGIRDSSGNIEVMEGINEGDKIIVSQITN